MELPYKIRKNERDDAMKIKRKIIHIDDEKCDGCGLCVSGCAEGAIEIIDGKARLVSERYCDGLGACLGECPRGALEVVDAEAQPFDEQAVKEHLAGRDRRGKSPEAPVAACCPSAMIRTFKAEHPQGEAGPDAVSELRHWPVQIRLVPPQAAFLKGADLLVAADCTPVAYPAFHLDFLKGKAVLIGCPKFDDVQQYFEKFRDIFAVSDIKSVTAVVMEVPCCRGLPVLVQRAAAAAGKHVPLETVTISRDGRILK